MNTITFSEWRKGLTDVILEELHPELQATIKSERGGRGSKQSHISSTIRDLVKRGEQTGLEGKTPKGSSRMWLTHEEHKPVTVDGVPTKMKIGTKVVIDSPLDKHRNKKEHPDPLGVMQNAAENSDHFLNSRYRILSPHDSKDGEFHTNEESGIFPPLVDHDHENHKWSVIGHTNDLKQGSFQRLTHCESHPGGISHEDFCDALRRDYDHVHGKYWLGTDSREEHLDHVREHPLVQKFLDHQNNYLAPPHDYTQKKNLGVWTHPVSGKEHIVARDHGFSGEVMDAYRQANRHKYKGVH